MLALALLVASSLAAAETVVTEGSAAIVAGDLSAARAQAVRNALAEAAGRASLSVRAVTGSGREGLEFNQTVVRAGAQVHRHQIVRESNDGALYQVTVSADLESGQGRTGGAVCREGHVKRVLIGGFPMLRPEHLRTDELAGYAYLTAQELARRLGDHPAVLVDHDGRLVVHFGVPERVVGDLPPDSQSVTMIRAGAEKHRAQYVLVGRYHSLEIDPDRSGRVIDVEVLVLDALTGACVARKRFTRRAVGEVVVPASLAFGSAGHYATDLGRAWAGVLTEVAGWAEATVSCLPFFARVLKVENRAIVFDAGAEHGVTIGDEFSAFRTVGRAVVTRGGEVLGSEKRRAGDVRVTSVYPRFAIGVPVDESANASGSGPGPGDELHSR